MNSIIRAQIELLLLEMVEEDNGNGGL
jgi:hypothetical protein